MLKKHGYIRVASVSNKIRLGDINYNITEIKNILDTLVNKGVDIAIFPEMSICGHTIYDLVYNDDLYNSILKGLYLLKEYSQNNNITFIVGAPIRINNNIYSCGISYNAGNIIGITPKYNDINTIINLFDEEIKVSNKLIYENNMIKYFIEFGDDLFSNNNDYNNAQIIFNLSNRIEYGRSSKDVKDIITGLAKKSSVAYVYSSSSIYESTTDCLNSGYTLIYNDDEIIEGNKYNLNSSIIYTDVDVFKINNIKLKNKFNINNNFIYTSFNLYENNNELVKKYSKHPFTEYSNDDLDNILNIQAIGLARRVMHLNNSKLVIGISGGSDSTLAFLVSLRAMKFLGLDYKNIIAITMPGFGTTNRTYDNSVELIKAAGATFKEISIKDACIQHYKDINHDMNKFDIAYENAQARERTQILFDIANQENGIVVGTGDLSELALGWATYNGDHMSNYSVNSSIPKTLVKRLINFEKDNLEGKIKDVLIDILNTPVSPELLPPTDSGEIAQITEKNIGPYILHDFFIYHFLGYNASIKKIYFLACHVFKDEYSSEEIKRVLTIFIKRFFTQQFKRNCISDGIKAIDISLSPRGDFKMSSDICLDLYLKEINDL